MEQDAPMTYLEELDRQVCNTPEYITCSALARFSEQLSRVMGDNDISNTALGIKSKCGRAQVWRVMNCEHGTTVATLGKLAAALGKDLEIRLVDRKESRP